jgi:prepilin-type N-terminal cleavage/methylation domain-containing protein
LRSRNLENTECFGDTDNRRRKRSDGGYSIVELIIVIAIIAVIVAAVSYSVVMIFSANAKACANNLQRAVNDCKVTAMGKADASLEIYGQDGKVYSRMTVDGVAQEPQKIGTNKVSVICETDADDIDISAGGSVTIAFDRSTGSFRDDTTVDTIVIAGGHREYELKLIRLTGKTELKLR